MSSTASPRPLPFSLRYLVLGPIASLDNGLVVIFGLSLAERIACVVADRIHLSRSEPGQANYTIETAFAP